MSALLESGPTRFQACASAPVWTYVYGANMLAVSVTDPLSHVISFVHDDFGRKTNSTTDLGYVTTFGYDNEDKLTSVTIPDPDGAGVGVTASVTRYSYDIYDRLVNIIDPLSDNTLFSYDEAGQMLTLNDPEGNTMTWAYAALGQVTMETIAHTRSLYHDAAGNLDRNERVTQYDYDKLPPDRGVLDRRAGPGAIARVAEVAKP